MSVFYGSRMQRTMSLLETSTEVHRNKVRILFYGQSIVKAMNAESIVSTLQKRYPHAIIEYENRAIDGFVAPSLVRTAVHGLYPYYPDLLVFHDYRGIKNGELERMIYNMRKYTTSEILIFNHQYPHIKDSAALVRRTKEDDNESDYNLFLAQKYGCEFVDVRKEWKIYVDQNPGINYNSLIFDTIRPNVHPNYKGKKLMEILILQHFRFNPFVSSPGWYKEIRSYDMRRFFEEKQDEIQVSGTSIHREEGVIIDSGMVSLDFTGNKIELIASPSMKGNFSNIDVFIDGVKPSEKPELYYCTQPSMNIHGKRPALKRVSLGDNPTVEKWKLVVTSVDHEKKYLEFEVIGEKTGFDGRGNNKSKFQSRSGKIIIDHSDYYMMVEDSYRKKYDTKEGFEVTWEVKPLFSDRIKYDPTESVYLVAQGLTNSEHTLQLVQNGDGDGFPIKSIRVHEPPLK